MAGVGDVVRGQVTRRLAIWTGIANSLNTNSSVHVPRCTKNERGRAVQEQASQAKLNKRLTANLIFCFSRICEQMGRRNLKLTLVGVVIGVGLFLAVGFS